MKRKVLVTMLCLAISVSALVSMFPLKFVNPIFSFSLSHSPFKAIFFESERFLPCHGLR